MKTFMEEYGKVIVVAIIVVALITIALLFKTSGMESINGIWRNFMTKSELGLAVNDSSESVKETIEGQTITEGSFTNKAFVNCYINSGCYDADCTFTNCTISGGSFAVAPDETQIAAGFVIGENPDELSHSQYPYKVQIETISPIIDDNSIKIDL